MLELILYIYLFSIIINDEQNISDNFKFYFN